MSDLPTGETPSLDILGREINQKHIAFERASDLRIRAIEPRNR
jgi:hypothetical protein